MDRETKILVIGLIADRIHSQIGKPYNWGVEVNLYDPNPKAFDCSELMEWGFYFPQYGVTLPDGAVNQYALVKDNSHKEPVFGDLSFFIERDPKNEAGRKVGHIYHVGFVFDHLVMNEARGDKRFNRVIERGHNIWQKFPNWIGSYYTHPMLVL